MDVPHGALAGWTPTRVQDETAHKAAGKGCKVPRGRGAEERGWGVRPLPSGRPEEPSATGCTAAPHLWGAESRGSAAGTPGSAIPPWRFRLRSTAPLLPRAPACCPGPGPQEEPGALQPGAGSRGGKAAEVYGNFCRPIGTVWDLGPHTPGVRKSLVGPGSQRCNGEAMGERAQTRSRKGDWITQVVPRLLLRPQEQGLDWPQGLEAVSCLGNRPTTSKSQCRAPSPGPTTSATRFCGQC